MKTLALALLLAACGGDSNPVDAQVADTHPANHDGTVDTATVADGPVADAEIKTDAGGPTLKLKNYLAWCSVSVDGHPASTMSEQDITVATGDVTLVATAAPGFILGTAPWHHTSGDTGAGEAGTVTGTGTAATSTVTAVVSSTGKCVWICCPFPNGTGCPATDQCP